MPHQEAERKQALERGIFEEDRDMYSARAPERANSRGATEDIDDEFK